MRNRNQVSEFRYQRVSPLADVAVQGRFGADKGVPGVELSVRHPAAIVSIIARRDKGGALATALGGVKGCAILWAGADQYYAVAEGRGESGLYRDLKVKLDGLASVTDQSHGRVIASEYWGKIYTVLDALSMNRTDAALVRVVVPVVGADAPAELQSETLALGFVRKMFPLLANHLPV